MKARGGKLTLKITDLPAGGDYILRLSGAEGTSGDVAWKVKVKLPKGYPFSLPDHPTRK